MRLPRFLSAVLALSLLALPGLARADQPGWIADAQTRCRVWNARPQPNERVTWSGACQNGFAQGEGVEQWFENGQPSIRYEGEFRHGKHNGHGVQTFNDGSRYEGEFRDGTRNGYGIATFADGRRYEGEYKDGARNGQGVETLANGSREEGEWRDGKWNGHPIVDTPIGPQTASLGQSGVTETFSQPSVSNSPIDQKPAQDLNNREATDQTDNPNYDTADIVAKAGITQDMSRPDPTFGFGVGPENKQRYIDYLQKRLDVAEAADKDPPPGSDGSYLYASVVSARSQLLQAQASLRDAEQKKKELAAAEESDDNPPPGSDPQQLANNVTSLKATINLDQAALNADAPKITDQDKKDSNAPAFLLLYIFGAFVAVVIVNEAIKLVVKLTAVAKPIAPSIAPLSPQEKAAEFAPMKAAEAEADPKSVRHAAMAHYPNKKLDRLLIILSIMPVLYAVDKKSGSNIFATLLWPVLFTGAYLLIGRRFIPDTKKIWLNTIAIQLGHFSSVAALGAILFYAGLMSLSTVITLLWPGFVILLIGLTWLYLKPSAMPVCFLIFYQVGCGVLVLIQVFSPSTLNMPMTIMGPIHMTISAAVVHMIFRILAVGTLVHGYLQYRQLNDVPNAFAQLPPRAERHTPVATDDRTEQLRRELATEKQAQLEGAQTVIKPLVVIAAIVAFALCFWGYHFGLLISIGAGLLTLPVLGAAISLPVGYVLGKRSARRRKPQMA